MQTATDRIELTIDATYLSGNGGWDVAAGIREIVQNARDAQLEHEAQMTVTHEAETLRIRNDGVTIPREAMLIGCTSKRDRDDLAGQYGEGLKLGVLVLLRAGHRVVIRNGGETWTPAIERSRMFDRDVLVFNITRGGKDRNRVQVEVSGVSKEAWASLRDRFLFLYSRPFDKVETSHGLLLTGPRFRGQVFVKGILVQQDPKLKYGYDLHNVKLDRDRRLIADWDLTDVTLGVWSEALTKRPDLAPKFFRMCERGEAKEVQGLSEYSEYRLSQPIVEQAAAYFLEKHGSEAVPVESAAEVKEIGHLGARGVVAPKSMRGLLHRVFGGFKRVYERLATEVLTTYSQDELRLGELTMLLGAVELCSKVEPVTLEQVQIVDFRSDGMRGQFRGGQICLARRVLSDRSLTLRVLIHEVSHRHGTDGEKSHVSELERIWAGVVEQLWSGV